MEQRPQEPGVVRLHDGSWQRFSWRSPLGQCEQASHYYLEGQKLWEHPVPLPPHQRSIPKWSENNVWCWYLILSSNNFVSFHFLSTFDVWFHGLCKAFHGHKHCMFIHVVGCRKLGACCLCDTCACAPNMYSQRCTCDTMCLKFQQCQYLV